MTERSEDVGDETTSQPWVTTWADVTVRVYEGPMGDDLSAWEFPEHYLPFICETTDGIDGIDFVSSDWSVSEKGVWEAISVGISLDDLIGRFMGCEDSDDFKQRRSVAIAALERAVERLKTEPFRGTDFC